MGTLILFNPLVFWCQWDYLLNKTGNQIQLELNLKLIPPFEFFFTFDSKFFLNPIFMLIHYLLTS